jgi:hypothetical protein
MILDLGLVLEHSSLFLFFLLKSILLSLTLSAPQTLCGQPLVTKCCPWSKIFASLAPFDLKTTVADNPYIYVTKSTKTLVLGRDDSISILVLEIIDTASCILLAIDNTWFLFVVGRARAGLTTHDATPHTLRKVDCLLL